MMKPFIDNYDDILVLLDEKVGGVEWNRFYENRERQVPFLTQNTLPDENLTAFLRKNPRINSAVEFGCGEGRNAIYMAKQGVTVTAYDSSPVAIENAKKRMIHEQVAVNFICQDIIRAPIEGSYDFIYDSGLLHHLAPHRRITYRQLLARLLKPGGYFGLTCFAWGENCGDEIDDWEYYNRNFSAGVAFTKERLIALFSPFFEVEEIRKYQNGVPNTIQGLQFMWTCLFRVKKERCC